VKTFVLEYQTSLENCESKNAMKNQQIKYRELFENAYLRISFDQSVIRNIRVGQGRISEFLKIERKTRQKGDANQYPEE